jgi:hypothetical protein
MLLTICVYDSSVDTEIINWTIIYTNRQEHSTFLWNYQYNYLIEKLSRTFNSSQKFSTILPYTQKVNNIQRVECFWRFVYMIVIFKLSDKNWMILMICVHDCSVDNIREKSFSSSQKLSTALSYTKIVKNIQLFFDIINRTIIYTNRQDRSIFICYYHSVDNLREELNVFYDLRIRMLYLEYQIRVECSWRFVYMIVLIIITDKNWTILTICVYDSSVDRQNHSIFICYYE